MKKLTSKIMELTFAVCEVVLGILLLINPVSFTSVIIIVLGLLLAALGVIAIMRHFKKSPAEAARGQDMMQGLLMVIGGIFCILKSDLLTTAGLPLLMLVYGIMILVSGMAKVQWAVDKYRLKADKWFWEAISAAVTVICAVFIICHPLSSAATMWIFIGITLLVEAVLDVLAVIFVKEA